MMSRLLSGLTPSQMDVVMLFQMDVVLSTINIALDVDVPSAGLQRSPVVTF